MQGRGSDARLVKPGLLAGAIDLERALFAAEFLGCDGEAALRVALEVRRRGTHLERPVRPGQRPVFLFWRLRREQSLFVVLAASGLLLQFGMQAIINIASAVHLMPTKGMTLPFISYGGSSLLAVSLGMGMMLALTRKRHGTGDK